VGIPIAPIGYPHTARAQAQRLLRERLNGSRLAFTYPFLAITALVSSKDTRSPRGLPGQLQRCSGRQLLEEKDALTQHEILEWVKRFQAEMTAEGRAHQVMPVSALASPAGFNNCRC
jgi:hypothetical protein